MWYKASYFIAVICFLTCSYGNGLLAQKTIEDRQIEAAVRAIGHEVLQAHGDTTSRVLPVEKEGDQYIIQFDTEFQLITSNLIRAVDTVVRNTDLPNHYMVEMEECESGKIIHSYTVEGVVDPLSIACNERVQPVACYQLHFTILGRDQATIALAADRSNYMFWTIPMFLVIVGLYLLFYQRAPATVSKDPYIIPIGNYRFDPRKMTLTLADESVELTSKESELLAVLHASANSTVVRDDILQSVWGDVDYVGRTLDVFISKLRKKLEGDPSVKIANIRGVGYRLVMSEG